MIGQTPSLSIDGLESELTKCPDKSSSNGSQSPSKTNRGLLQIYMLTPRINIHRY